VNSGAGEGKIVPASYKTPTVLLIIIIYLLLLLNSDHCIE